jgi:hypothetical protein
MEPKMKYLLLLSFFISSPLLANDLLGVWSDCELQEDGSYTEHIVEFSKNNVEFEVNAIYGKSKLPCQGKVEIAIASFWHYQNKNNKLNYTLFSTYVILGTDFWVKEFNNSKVCGHKSWIKNNRFDCESDKSGLITSGRGHKINYEYEIINNELHATRNGETMVFKRIK